MSRYYTPSVEEFHIGFEFEHLNCEGRLVVGELVGSCDWHKETCDADWLNIINDDYEHDEEEVKRYRVKFLDREDIESFGFSIKSGVNNRGKFYNSYGVNLYHRDEDQKVIIGDKDLGSVIFNGNIKNKNEFKRVLKQIGLL